jgi:hypothetical protein
LGPPAQQPGNKIEQRPQVAQVVFDGRPRQGQAGAGGERLDAFGLARAGVLDGLGLVEHHQRPRHTGQPGLPPHQPVGRDHQVAISKFQIRGGGDSLQGLASAFRAVQHLNERRRKPGEPCRTQERRDDQQMAAVASLGTRRRCNKSITRSFC